jgi:tetratricopeptide (TPR) repeat protein/DNA-binding CsgD family transcriptional regulator
MKRLTCFLILLLCFLISDRISGQNKQEITAYTERQTKLFPVIFSNPVAARNEINLLMIQGAKMPDTIQSMNLNLLGVYYGAINKLDSALFALEKSLTLLPEKHWRKSGRYHNIAIIYRKKNNLTKGLEMLQLAESAAITFGDSLMLATIYGEKSSHYAAQQMYNLAIDFLMRSIRMMERNPKSSPMILYKEKQKLGNLYFKLGNAEFAEKIYREILPFFKKEGAYDTYYFSLVNLGDFLLQQNKLSEAEKSLNEGLVGLDSFPNSEYQIHVRERLAALYYKQGKIDAAGKYYREVSEKALETSSPKLIYYLTEYALHLQTQKDKKSLSELLQKISKIDNLKDFLDVATQEEKIRYYLLIGETYEELGDFVKSSHAFRQAYNEEDSLNRLFDLYSAREIQAKYQNDLQQKQNELLSKENWIQQMILFISIISLVVLIIAFLWRLSYSRSKERINKLHFEALSREKKLLTDKLATEMELTSLKEKIIFEQKNDLMVKNMENARLNQQLKELLQTTTTSVSAENSKFKINLEKNDDYWKDIILKFQLVNPDFVQKLKSFSQELTKGDIEFCSMARMNLSNKEIASLLNISLESVRTKKYRLMKKLNLQESQDFYNWILTL